MRTRLLPLHLGITAAFVVGCGAHAEDPVRQAVSSTDDPFAAMEQNLTAIATQCTFNPAATPRTMAVVLTSGEMAFIKRAGTAPDDFLQVNGGECNNPVPLSGSTAVQRLTVTSTDTGNESAILDFTNGSFLLSTVAATPNITVNLGAGTADMLGVRLNDATIPSQFLTYGATGINVASSGTEVIRDIIPTGVEINRVSLGDGDDTFTARGDTGTGVAFDPGVGGSLEVFGGAGADTFLEGPIKTPREVITGGSGIDTISYSQRTAGVTVVVATAGGAADTLNPDGESGELDDIKDDVEIITGGAGNDLLVGGGSVAETITGNAGNDTLTGGTGADILLGGDGADRFVETGTNATSGDDTFTGGNGIDTIDYSSRTVAVTVVLDGTTASGLSGESDKVGADIENIVGGSGADTLVGNALNNVIQGRAGADSIDGGGGIDTVDYSDHTTNIVVALAATPANSCASPVTQAASADVDIICESVENITGGTGNDSLVGGSGPNELVGGDGIDTLLGNGGDDILEGGSATNTDVNVLNGGAGIDVCYGGTSNTKVACEF